jgi:LPS-assembly protein
MSARRADRACRKAVRLAFACLVALAGGRVCSAAAQGVPGGAAEPPPPQGIEVTADRLEYRENKKYMIGIGNVVIARGEEVLKADYVQVQTETLDAFARGNVTFQRGGWDWAGRELAYNFRTGVGDFGQFDARRGVFSVYAEDSEPVDDRVYAMRKVTLTTCEKDDQEFRLRAQRATLTDGRMLRAHHVVMYLGGIPVLYIPFVKLDLEDDLSRWTVSVGQKGSWGVFALIGYRHEFTEILTGQAHLHLRSSRGVGVGEDLFWKDPASRYSGGLSLYGMHDSEPLQDDYDRENFEDEVDNERYRVRLEHMHLLSDRDTMIVDLTYESDPLVREQFFERDFRQRSVPENRVSFSHRGDSYNAGALAILRLNDFYETDERLPELTLDLYPRPLGDSRFYYESESSLVRLERLYPERDDRDSISTLRADTWHRLSYPGKYFGFLSLIPSVAGRATYYSDLAPETTSITNPVSFVTTNGTTVLTNEVTTLYTDRGSDTRTLAEFGLDTRFKAFKLIHNERTAFGEGLRHVVEPYALYRYRPEPSVPSDHLYNFDSIDRIDRRHTITPGMRNKLQTRREGRLVDLVDLDVNTTYRIEKEDEEEDFGPLTFDLELRPFDPLSFDFDGHYDWYESEVTRFNARSAYRTENTTFGIDYGFRKDDKNLASAYLEFEPAARWNLALYGRYDIDASDIEEHYYVVQHDFDCVGVEFGLRMLPGNDRREDETEFWFALWLLAFPESQIRYQQTSAM